MKELALYIHIPFCISKCYYCDFNSFSNKKLLIPDYIYYLINEIKLYKDKLEDYTIKTIFFGGGTPSSIEAIYIGKVLETIHENLNVDNLEEISIEVNPKTIDGEKVKIYKEMGINRISIGCQSLRDDILTKIGRVHNSKDFYETYNLLRKYDFSNINVDLMFGLPGQTFDDLFFTLEEVVNLGVEHISFYSLIIEEGTKYYDWYKDGEIILPDEEEERNMYHDGVKYLKSKCYEHYEISNLAKKGYACKHNLFYWTLKPYIGVGLGSHSNIWGKRYWNHESFREYFESLSTNKLPISGEETIDREMEIAEYLILGLRLVQGIDKKDFLNRFKVSIDGIYGEVFDKHKENGLIYIDDKSIRLTEKGLDLCNLVFVDLLP